MIRTQPQASAKRRKSSKQALAPWLFLAPSLVLVSVFVLIPFADAVRRSFFSAMSREFVGLRNYISVLNNEAFKLAAGNTARFVAICIPILLVFSLLLALLVQAVKEKRGIFKTSFLLPMAIPVASVVLLWKVLFHPNGLINSILGLEGVDWIGSDLALFVLVFTYVWKNTGYNMVLWLAGLNGINPALYESAQVDGAGALKRLLHITLPNLVPTLFTVSVLSLLNSFKVFREAYLIAGSYPHESIYMLQHLFNNWFLSLDIDKMCAGAVMMAIVITGLILLLMRAWGKESVE